MKKCQWKCTTKIDEKTPVEVLIVARLNKETPMEVLIVAQLNKEKRKRKRKRGDVVAMETFSIVNNNMDRASLFLVFHLALGSVWRRATCVAILH